MGTQLPLPRKVAQQLPHFLTHFALARWPISAVVNICSSIPLSFIAVLLTFLKTLLLIFGRPFVKRFALCYWTVVCPVLSVCDVGVLWSNGWMDQDGT